MVGTLEVTLKILFEFLINKNITIMSVELYYGIHLTDNEFHINCCEDFVFTDPIIKTMKDWLMICDIFNEFQVKHGIDFNIVQNILRLYVEKSVSAYIDLPNGKVHGENDLIPIDKYGYSAFYENGYITDYDFCEHLEPDNEYTNEINNVENNFDNKYQHVLGVQISSLKYHYNGKISFTIDDLLKYSKLPSVIKFNECIRNHKHLQKFEPRFFILGRNNY